MEVVDPADQRSPNKDINMLCLRMQFVIHEDMKGLVLGFNEKTERFPTHFIYFSHFPLEMH